MEPAATYVMIGFIILGIAVVYASLVANPVTLGTATGPFYLAVSFYMFTQESQVHQFGFSNDDFQLLRVGYQISIGGYLTAAGAAGHLLGALLNLIGANQLSAELLNDVTGVVFCLAQATVLIGVYLWCCVYRWPETIMIKYMPNGVK
jgi:hypothetical protein